MTDEALKWYNDGYFYHTGQNGYPLDYQKALSCFMKASELQHSDAMNYVGLYYKEGREVSKDFNRAQEWFQKSLNADPHNIYPLYNLGLMYFNGEGCEVNPEKAHEYFGKIIGTAEEKDPFLFASACYYEALLLMNHDKREDQAWPLFFKAGYRGNIPGGWHNFAWLIEKGVVPDSIIKEHPSRTAAALSYYMEGAKIGFAQSMFSVGRMYVLLNRYQDAMGWFQKAASQGYEPAKEMLKIASSGKLRDVFGGLSNLLHRQ